MNMVRGLGPVVPSIVSFTSSLVVILLTVLVSTISISQLFFLKKNVKSYSHFPSKKNSVYAIFNGQSFNDTLTNDIVSFEQLGPDEQILQISPGTVRLQNYMCGHRTLRLACASAQADKSLRCLPEYTSDPWLPI